MTVLTTAPSLRTATSPFWPPTATETQSVARAVAFSLTTALQRRRPSGVYSDTAVPRKAGGEADWLYAAEATARHDPMGSDAMSWPGTDHSTRPNASTAPATPPNEK